MLEVGRDDAARGRREAPEHAERELALPRRRPVEERVEERREHARTVLHPHSEEDQFPTAPEVYADLDFDDTLQHAYDTQVNGLSKQFAIDQANEMARLAKERMERERKAEATKTQLVHKVDLVQIQLQLVLQQVLIQF